MDTTRSHLISRIEEFLRETGMTPAALGERAVGCNKFWARLTRDGRGITLRTADRVEAWMADYRAGRHAHKQD